MKYKLYEDAEDLDFYMDEEPEQVKEPTMNAHDAFLMTMDSKGLVDIHYMEKISGLDEEVLIRELIGKEILPDPEKYDATKDYAGCFITKQQCLAGNIIRKYDRAYQLNKTYEGLFDETVKFLEKNIPETVRAGEIYIHPGAPFIPAKYLSVFFQNLMELDKCPNIEYNEYRGKWSLEISQKPDYQKRCVMYGTKRMDAVMIFRHILNAIPVKVYDQVEKADGSRSVSVLNKEETLAAREKEKLILKKWAEYIHSIFYIKRDLEEAYLEYFSYRVQKYDGSYLTLPGLNSKIKLYKHQLDGIARIILSKNTLLAHDTGAGKTLVYECAVHELMRMGLSKKALVVVPNHTLESVVNVYMDAYPESDNILPIYPKDFIPAKRNDAINKIRMAKNKIIFMAYSSFDMLSLSRECVIARKESQIRECYAAMMNTTNASLKRSLETELKSLNKELDVYRAETDYDETACFDKLGIDLLVVDEAHNYKNITLNTSVDNIVGLHSKGARKSDNLLEKTEYIQTNNGRVVFATATPLTNSLADLFVFQRYLQPVELKLSNIYHFGNWIQTFCSKEYMFEIDVDSTNYRFKTRFSGFHNLPELMSMFSNVCDFYQSSSDSELELPEFAGYENVTINKSEAQIEYMKNIVKRTEKVRSHKVDLSEDNLLLITIDGRKCALDIRLVNEDATFSDDETKICACAQRIVNLYMNNPDTTQVVFCDISTPKTCFNVYDELKCELIRMGIPGQEITFIHEAKTEAERSALEKRFNDGKIRILIGSTIKLGTGSNVQERLLAVHHLDVPWKPSDMVQREGRIRRQGNKNKQVFLYRYCTQQSFDAYLWQLLERKQRFIAQFLSGALSVVHRSERDLSDTILSYSEIKALAIGNPLIKKRVILSNQLEATKIKQRQKRNELMDLNELLHTLPRRIEQKKAFIENAESDNVFYKSHKQTIPKAERRMFGEELIWALEANIGLDKERYFETYQGFDVILPKKMQADKAHVLLKREGGNTYKVVLSSDKTVMGCSMSLDYVLNHLEDTIALARIDLKKLHHQMKEAEEMISEGNPYDVEVEQLSAQLKEMDRILMEEE